jgi:hypothetical protein
MRAAFSASARMAVHLFDLADGREIGVLSNEQFQFLADYLESEDADDDDYYLNEASLQALQADGADPRTINTLRTAMAGRTEMDIRWQRDQPTDSASE